MSYGGFSAATCKGLSFEYAEVIVVSKYPSEVSFPDGQPSHLGVTNSFDLSQIKPGQIAAFAASFFSDVDGGRVGFRWYGPQGNLVSYGDYTIPSRSYPQEPWQWYWVGNWLVYSALITNGNYRLDILYNGSVINSHTFTITGVVAYKGKISRMLIWHEPLEDWEEILSNHRIRQILHGAEIHLALEVINETTINIALHSDLVVTHFEADFQVKLRAISNQDKVVAPGESIIVEFEPFVASQLDDYVLSAKLSVAGLVDYVWELDGKMHYLESVDGWTKPYPDEEPEPRYKGEISRLLMWHEPLSDWKEIYLNHKVWEIPLGAEINLSPVVTNESEFPIQLHTALVVTFPDGTYISLNATANQDREAAPGESLTVPFEPFIASQLSSTFFDDYIISIKLSVAGKPFVMELDGLTIAIVAVEDWEPEEPPEEIIDFDLTRPSVSPTEITPGTSITITCPVTSACTKEQTATAKVKIYEGSIYPGHGRLITTKTSPAFTISPEQTYGVIVHHTAIAGDIDRRDVEVEVYVGGKLVKESEWDDVYYVGRPTPEEEEPAWEDWLPMSPLIGPPLPAWMGITWPWYKGEPEHLGLPQKVQAVGGGA